MWSAGGRRGSPEVTGRKPKVATNQGIGGTKMRGVRPERIPTPAQEAHCMDTTRKTHVGRLKLEVL